MQALHELGRAFRESEHRVAQHAARVGGRRARRAGRRQRVRRPGFAGLGRLAQRARVAAVCRVGAAGGAAIRCATHLLCFDISITN